MTDLQIIITTVSAMMIIFNLAILLGDHFMDRF